MDYYVDSDSDQPLFKIPQDWKKNKYGLSIRWHSDLMFNYGNLLVIFFSKTYIKTGMLGPVRVLAVTLPIQVSANDPGKQWKMVGSWTLTGNLEEAPDSQLWTALALPIAAIWGVMQQMEDLSLPLSSPPTPLTVAFKNKINL